MTYLYKKYYMIWSNIWVERFGLKDSDFDAYSKKEYFLKGGFYRCESRCCSRANAFFEKVQAKEKNTYGMKQRVTGII